MEGETRTDQEVTWEHPHPEVTYITRREAAQKAKVHINTIRLWEQAGRVSTVKSANGQVLIPEHEIDNIMRERKVASMDEKTKVAILESQVETLQQTLEDCQQRWEQERNERLALMERMMDLVLAKDERQSRG